MTNDEEYFKIGYQEDLKRATPEFRETIEKIVRLRSQTQDVSETGRIRINELKKLQKKIFLNEYMEAIGQCQSKKELQDRYGLYDNYEGFLRFNYEKIVSDFKNNSNYVLEEYKDILSELTENDRTELQELKSQVGFRSCDFNPKDSIREFKLRFRESLSSQLFTLSDKERIRERDKERREKYGNYSISFQLHGDSFKMKEILLDVVRYVKENNIPMCLLGATHWFTPVYFPSKLKGGEE